MTEPVRVLHVDDDPRFAETAAEFLERASDALDVETETGARAALDRLGEGEFDCIVSDYDMPDMDGIEFLERVRESHPDLPFLLYTGKGSEAVASEAMTAGATDYLQKGTGTEQYELLANRVENAVERYRERQRAADLERVRTIVRDVNQALVRASDRDEVESELCDIVTEAEPYRLAAVGDVTRDAGRFVPRAAAGAYDGSLPPLSLPDGGAGPEHTVGAAVRDRQLAVADDVPDHSDSQWGDALAEAGVRAFAAVPLEYGEKLYGALVVCADWPRAFDERERDLLDELAGDVAHALDAVETPNELARERDRRAALFENSPDPVMENAFQGDTPIVESVNAAFEETFGYDAEAVRGRPADEVVVPESEQAEHERLRRRVLDGETVEREVRRETASGVRDFLLRVIPLERGDRPDGAYVWYTDVTDRKERERELARAKERFQKVFEHSNDAIMLLDPRGGEIRDANPRACEMLGYDREELLSLSPADVHPDEVERFREFVDTVYEEGAGWTDELACTTRDSERIPAEISASVVEVEDRRHMLAVIRDVTERKERERELERQNARLDEFASVVSHDLRNPLGMANGRLTLAREECDSDHLDAVGDALDRMERIIDDVLLLAREGETIGARTPVDLDEAVAAAWTVVADDAGGADLVVADRERELGTVEADGERLRQLLENLFRNALDHAGPDVTVRVEPLETGFAVEDDGPGIPAEERDQVFDAGYSTGDDGTGVGLHVVGQVADAHGWDVRVADGRDGGARFEITGVAEPDAV